MGKREPDNLQVTCPCCQAKLVVDPVFGAVLSHEVPVKPGPNIDLENAHGILAEQHRQREDKFSRKRTRKTSWRKSLKRP